MYVSHELKIVYFGVPRTGSRAVAQFLKERHKAHAVGKSVRLGEHHGIDPHTLKRCREFDYRIIATVRNPWDVIVSWWHHNPEWFGKPNAEFAQFARRFPRHQKNKYLLEDRLFLRYTREATHVIKWERLEKDLARVIRQPVELPVLGASDRQPYQTYYDAELRDFIGEAFAEEIAQFKYSFKGKASG